ncbi:hypothetical protein [Flagellimonas baculiformis]|uniref:hypothetical protein n=1 Tax=Flagellimonas baculiformis TaxID=3067310 RepID=UPI00296F6E20|nr:hypothetical protein [Muricauda sp. D6]
MIIIYTFFTELLGVLIKFNNNFQFFSDERFAWHNVIIYNIYQLVFFLFFFEVYRKITKNQLLKKWISYGSILSVLIYLVNAILYNPLHNQLTHAHIIVSLMLIVVLAMYFKEKHAEESPYSQKHNLLFWVSVGLMVFYTLFPVILTLFKLKLNITVHIYLRPILLGSIVFMYSCFIIGLLVGKRKAFR